MLNKDLLLDRMGAKGITCKEAAEVINVSKNTFTKILNGERYLDTLEIDLLCDLLNITSNDAKCNIFLCKVSQ